MKHVLALVFVFAQAFGPAEQNGVSAMWASQKTVTTDVEAQALREMAGAIPLGSRVKAQTSAGKRVSGTLMSVTGDAVIIKKKTRLPEPAVTVPFAELTRLDLQGNEGMSIGKVLGVGLAAGAGAILTLFAFVAMLDD